MTSKEKGLEKYIKNVGKIGTIKSEKLQINVKIIDVSWAFGRFMYVIEPVSGDGCQKLNVEKVIIK